MLAKHVSVEQFGSLWQLRSLITLSAETAAGGPGSFRRVHRAGGETVRTVDRGGGGGGQQAGGGGGGGGATHRPRLLWS